MEYDELNNYMENNNLFNFKKEYSQNSFVLSSEGELNNYKINDENFNNIFETEWKTIRRDNNSITLDRNGYDSNEICRFHFFIINEKKFENNIKFKNIQIKTENIKKSIKKLGRKTKRDNINEIKDDYEIDSHDKFSDDNLRKKCKNIVLKYTFEFINIVF